MNRVQYTEKLRVGYVKSGRSRHGLSLIGNPFAATMIGGKLQLCQCEPSSRAWGPLRFEHTADLTALSLFCDLLQDPDAHARSNISPLVREHMRNMRRQVRQLRPEAAAACWQTIAGESHVEALKAYYRDNQAWA